MIGQGAAGRGALRLSVVAAVAAVGVVALSGRARVPAATLAATAQEGARRTGAPAPDPLMRRIEMLADPAMEGRGAGTPGGRRARAFVEAEFRVAGLQPAGRDGFVQPFTAPPRRGMSGPIEAANVLGRCAGRTLSADAPVAVVSAHYDHEGIRNGRLYPGADDNASGVAVLVDLAAACIRTPFSHDVVFAAFDAEETGLQGARAFLREPPVATARIALNVNLDMVSRSDRREIFVAGTHYTHRIRTLLAAPAERAAVTVRFGHDVPGTGRDDWTQQSDHGPFHDAGVPFVYFGVEDHADYHQPTDTPDKIDPRFVRDVAALVLDALRTLDAALPLR